MHDCLYFGQKRESIIISMQQVLQNSKKKYSNIINLLEKSFTERANDQTLELVFKMGLVKEFKLQMIADATMEEVLRQYYDKCQRDYLGTQIFCDKLAFIDRLNTMLYRIEFISRRKYLQLRQDLVAQRNSPANKWLEDICYLRNSSTVDQFRYEFLTRYCGMKEDEVNDLLDEGGENLKEKLRAQYEAFFKRCLAEGVPAKVVSFIDDFFSQNETKTEMLSARLLHQLERQLAVTEVGENEAEMAINRALVEVAQENAYANDQQAQQRLEDEVRLIETALQKFSGLNIIKTKGLQLHLARFGSLTSGFAGTDADLDLTILTNCYVNQVDFLKLLHEFLRKEYRVQQGRGGGGRRVSVQLISKANTPLITLHIVERGRVDLKIDVIVNNILGVINSKFLRVYSQVKWIRNLGLLAKLWGKSKGIIGKSALSSYAIVLMLLHYLIKTRRVRAILDHRVTTNKAYFEYKRMKQAEVEHFKVYYEFNDNPKDITTEERVNYYKLFMGFMRYYAEEFWKEDQRDRIVTVDQSKDRSIDPETALTIKDPFDEPHNPGRLKAESREFLVQKCKEAYEVLKAAKEERVRSLFVA